MTESRIKDISGRISPDLKNILALTAVAFVLRLVISSYVRVIETDSAFYGYLAREFAKGNISAILNPAWPGFYSFLSALISLTGIGMEKAMQLVSVLSGTLSVAVLYIMARSVFGKWVAVVSATILTFHPRMILYSELALTESLYAFVFLCAVAALTVSVLKIKNTDRSFSPQLLAFISGIFFFLVYATRPEGLILFGASVLFMLVSLVKPFCSRKRLLSVLILLVCGFLVLFVPFTAMFYSQTGRFLIGEKGKYNFYVTYREDYNRGNIDVKTGWINRIPPQRGSGKRVIDIGSTGKDSQDAGEYNSSYQIVKFLRRSFWSVITHTFKTFFVNLFDKLPSCEYHTFFFLTLLGVLLPRKRSRVELLWGMCVFVLLLILSVYFPLRRFFVVIVPVMVVWAGVGVIVGLGSLPPCKFTEEMSVRLIPDTRKRLYKSILLIIVAVSLLFSYWYAKEQVKGRDYPDEYLIAGEWIKENFDGKPIIASRKPEVSFYAEGYFEPLTKVGPGEIVNWMKENGVTHLVLDARMTPKAHPELVPLFQEGYIPEGLKIVFSDSIKDNRIVVFSLK